MECAAEGGRCWTGVGKWVRGKSSGERVCAVERKQALRHQASCSCTGTGSLAVVVTGTVMVGGTGAGGVRAE